MKFLFIYKIYFFLFYVHECFLCMYSCIVCFPRTHAMEDRRYHMYLLELEFEAVVSCHGGTGNQT